MGHNVLIVNLSNKNEIETHMKFYFAHEQHVIGTELEKKLRGNFSEEETVINSTGDP